MNGSQRRARLHRVALGLGSNVGDRLSYLQRAVSGLGDVPGLYLVSASPVFETDPVGGPEQRPFLNAVLVAETELTPRALLGHALDVERRLGRVRTTRWGPRTIDIDVLLVGDLVVDEPGLEIPHPRVTERAFVLVPWSRADPLATMPDGTSIGELARRLPTAGVRERDDLALELPQLEGKP